MLWGGRKLGASEALEGLAACATGRAVRFSHRGLPAGGYGRERRAQQLRCRQPQGVLECAACEEWSTVVVGSGTGSDGAGASQAGGSCRSLLRPSQRVLHAGTAATCWPACPPRVGTAFTYGACVQRLSGSAGVQRGAWRRGGGHRQFSSVAVRTTTLQCTARTPAALLAATCHVPCDHRPGAKQYGPCSGRPGQSGAWRLGRGPSARAARGAPWGPHLLLCAARVRTCMCVKRASCIGRLNQLRTVTQGALGPWVGPAGVCVLGSCTARSVGWWGVGIRVKRVEWGGHGEAARPCRARPGPGVGSPCCPCMVIGKIVGT